MNFAVVVRRITVTLFTLSNITTICDTKTNASSGRDTSDQTLTTYANVY